MRHGKWARKLRPIASLALLGAVTSGCGVSDGDHYGGGGYYGSPGRYSSYHRGDGHRRSSQPRVEKWSQQRLQQHWREQARKAR